MVVHSSLVNKYNLGFDANLSYDFYTEAFEIDAYEEHGIPTCILPVKARHYSYGNMNNRRFFSQRRYLWEKYKEAKRAKRQNEGRIRYLENMIRTAHVIEIEEDANSVTLFDYVLILNEKNGQEKEIQIVTTLRQNALLGYISKESPLGGALLGAKVGDRVLVTVNERMSYYVKVLKITKGEDNEDIPISGY